MPVQIRIVAGPNMGKVCAVPDGKPLVLGRGSEADIQVDDPSVSRTHCQVRGQGGHLFIEDLHSRSGVILNGTKVSGHPLKVGDVVLIGTTKFQMEEQPLAEQQTIDPSKVAAPVVTQAKPASGPTQAKGAVVMQPAAEKGDKPPEFAADRMGELSGYQLGAFVIGPMLAMGQSGPVFRAVDIKQGRAVALKVLWPEFARDDDEVKRFVRAMKTMMPIQHPHLVALYGAGKAAGYCWLAMEFVDGESVAQVMKKAEPANFLDWKDALRVGVHVSRALVYAHHERVIHRNITPNNILISKDRVAKLGDLMLSKALEGSLAGHITGQGQLLGDIHYLAPERTSGVIGEVDERSDLYGLGATLYAALTGRPPLQGKSMIETVLKIRQEKPAAARTLRPGIPAELDQAMLKLLEKQPANRYQKAAELMIALQQMAKTHAVEV